jgi:alpha-L-fucosidase
MRIVKPFFLLFSFAIFSNCISAQPKPSAAQLAWHDMEYYFFFHFGPNTFTDLEWGHGTESEDMFNPTELDCRQWVRTAKAAGAKGVIITAKHHDGFCLWPSKYSKHTVRESKWKNGKGDVLKELSAACKEYGLKFGVYISPWDRNHPDYGTEKYNDVFVNMMKELFTNYGPIWELWWDGANGEGPNGKLQVYDWKRFRETVKKLSPNTVIFSDVGPHVRWVGNESGIAGKTNWNTLDTAGFTPGKGGPNQDTLSSGNKYGKAWIPAECDVSIRPGWFYHEAEDSKVRTPENLFDLWLKSVGRGANLLLNIPPDRRGKIYKNDSLALMGFRNLRDQAFKSDLLKGRKLNYLIENWGNGGVDGSKLYMPKDRISDIDKGLVHKNEQMISFSKPEKINCIVLRENIANGQMITGYKIIIFNGKEKSEIVGTTIGHKRILSFPPTTAESIEVYLTDMQNKDNLKSVSAYLINETLIEKQ